MYTIEMLKKKISELTIENDNKKMDIAKNEAKISVFEDMINELDSQKKELTESEMIRIASDVIKSDSQIQRVKKIVSALKNEGFEIDGNALSSKLIKTGKFRINKDSKYWEIVNDEDVSGMFE